MSQDAGGAAALTSGPGALNAESPPPASSKSAALQAAAADLRAGRPFVLVENGQPKQFRLALNQLFFPQERPQDRWRRIAPQVDAGALIRTTAAVAAKTGQQPGLVLYPEDAEERPAVRRILTDQWLVRTSDRQMARRAMERAGFAILEEPDYAPEFLVAAARSGGAVGALEAIAQLPPTPAILEATPLLLHQLASMALPNDFLFDSQWHLNNTGQRGGKAGLDIAVSGVWDEWQGEGMRIAIVDDGLDLAHPDLLPNLDTMNGYDWNDSPPDASPWADPDNGDGDRHGTAVAGLAAARGGNEIGISGAAPRAKMVGFRLIAAPSTDAAEAQAVTRGNDIIQVKNNSWGMPNFRDGELGWAGPLLTAAMESAAKTGRGGLGTISVWASGNGRPYDQGNKDAYSNSIYGITVGGVLNTGALALYSEGGCHLTVVGPTSGAVGATTTTDHRGVPGYNDGATKGQLPDANYTNAFNGTSAAAPVVSGVIALILQANPHLGWRDVKEILLRSSTKLFPTDPNWVSRTGGASPSEPLIKHHDNYGGGLIHAKAAIDQARTWVNAGPMIRHSRSLSQLTSIPDNDPKGITLDFDFSAVTDMRVEQVTVKLHLTHRYRGDIHITLRSPGGTVSTLAARNPYDYGRDYINWTFSSVRHWGEAAQGTWTLACKDLAASETGTFRTATVTLFGSQADTVKIVADPRPALVPEGEPASFSVGTSGYGYVRHQWRKNRVGTGTTIAMHRITSTKLADAGMYDAVATNLTGTATSAGAPLGVVNRTISGQTINEGANCTFKVAAAGPGLTYQWLRNGEALVNDARISGATSAVLSIKAVQPGDEAAYLCRVSLSTSFPVLLLDTLPATLSVRLKPVLQTPAAFTPGVVSGFHTFAFTAHHGATRFAATGLPPGMTFSSTTGVLSGTPNAAGTFKIKVTASNAAGASTPVEVAWVIERLPLSCQGVFNGLIDRSDDLNGGLGGRFTCTVSPTGLLTGTMVLGGKSQSVSGRLNVPGVGLDPTARMQIKRAAPLAPLTVDLSINVLNGRLVGSLADTSGGSAAMSGWRNPWSASRNALEFLGTYNNAVAPSGETAANAAVPHGAGFARLSIAATGTAVWTGKAADANSLTCSTTLGPGGEVSLHAMVSANAGSIQGWTNITDGNVDGTLSWFKKPQPSISATRSYRAGIPHHSLTIMGARYAAPAAGTPVLNLQPSLANARLVFISGGLAADIEQRFELTPANAARLPLSSELNPLAAKMTLTPSTGIFSGSFTLKNADPLDVTPPIAVLTRVAPFAGVVVTRPGFERPMGHFQLAELPDAIGETISNTPVWSGAVFIEAAPD